MTDFFQILGYSVVVIFLALFVWSAVSYLLELTGLRDPYTPDDKYEGPDEDYSWKEDDD